MARRSRQEKYPDTHVFHFHNANPKNRATGDCTFRAICTALNQSWEQTVMEMAEMSCKTGYSINDSKGIGKYLESKGWVKCKQPRKWDNTKYTGEEFCEELREGTTFTVNGISCDKDTNIIANIGGHHIVAIIDGKVWDTWDSTDGCIGNYWVKKG